MWNWAPTFKCADCRIVYNGVGPYCGQCEQVRSILEVIPPGHAYVSTEAVHVGKFEPSYVYRPKYPVTWLPLDTLKKE